MKKFLILIVALLLGACANTQQPTATSPVVVDLEHLWSKSSYEYVTYLAQPGPVGQVHTLELNPGFLYDLTWQDTAGELHIEFRWVSIQTDLEMDGRTLLVRQIPLEASYFSDIIARVDKRAGEMGSDLGKAGIPSLIAEIFIDGNVQPQKVVIPSDFKSNA